MSISDIKEQDCIGCNTYLKSLKNGCGHFNKDIACPCSICFIKMICTEACELLIMHSNKLRVLKRIGNHYINS